MSQKHEISCWKCHEMTSLETRNEFDGCCWACGEEIDLDDYLIKAMDKRDEHYAALSAVTAERDRLRDAAGKAIAWLDAEQNESGVGIYRRLNLCRDAENSLRAAMAAKEAEPEHVCSGCGAKGWTGNCLECIPY